MADSDDEYVDDLSEVEEGEASTSNGYGTRSNRANLLGGTSRQKERWEDITRSWDAVEEGADGTLAGAIDGLMEAEKRKRILKDTTPVQRGIIRHFTLILDCSSAMLEKDLRPSRYLLTIRHSITFVARFFEQNPISQLAVIGMRDGLAIRISPLSGNPAEHIDSLSRLRTKDPHGSPSLQNALEMSRAELAHTPSHGTREAIIIMGALMSADPGDIQSTIRALTTDHITVSVIGLAARMAICSELVQKTHSFSSPATADANPLHYGIVLHEDHLLDLLLAHTTPPAVRSEAQSQGSLLMMGFPNKFTEAHASLCACHSHVTKGGFRCPRCESKVCKLPSQCPVCQLQLVQSTHLARYYHHLFPLRNYVEVSWAEADRSSATACFACLAEFPAVPDDVALQEQGQKGVHKATVGASGASESSRYRCTNCGEHFCINCDVYMHETVHNCPGCLSKPAEEYVGDS